ncbi:MAG: hypothetical protein JST11_08875 [Acidobacteria bacterium]|nr:hypothetical protein [Acidobacteriota bacterium]
MIRVVVLWLSAAAMAQAVEFRIQFGALERMLAEQVFTQEGRRYVRGNRGNKCNFAYLEKPQVRGDNGRLLMRAHFTGRAALNLVGQCVGLGDAFDAVITAVPVYRNGAVGLQEVKVVSAGKTSYYIRKVCAAMEASLSRDFKYPLEREAQQLLESPGATPQYRREVRKFNVPDIRVAADVLVLSVDFEMTIR